MSAVHGRFSIDAKAAACNKAPASPRDVLLHDRHGRLPTITCRDCRAVMRRVGRNMLDAAGART